jgi:hypothetical protein
MESDINYDNDRDFIGEETDFDLSDIQDLSGSAAADSDSAVTETEPEEEPDPDLDDGLENETDVSERRKNYRMRKKLMKRKSLITLMTLF